MLGLSGLGYWTSFAPVFSCMYWLVFIFVSSTFYSMLIYTAYIIGEDSSIS